MTIAILVCSGMATALLACGGPQGGGAGAPAEPNVVAQEVTYSADGITMKGYLAYDSARPGKRPGVLVVHEWWGHNPYARKRARMLAELGYTALAVDMYGDGKLAQHPRDAGMFSAVAVASAEGAKARFVAALELLRAHELTDPERVAAIGYCFGGSVVLNAARMGVDLDGVVSFHGALSTMTPAQPGVVKAKVLVCHGADDSFAPPKQVEAFEQEMNEAGVSYELIAYPGAVHSFTNPEADELAKKFGMAGVAYNAEADQASWADMQCFLEDIFK